MYAIHAVRTHVPALSSVRDHPSHVPCRATTQAGAISENPNHARVRLAIFDRMREVVKIDIGNVFEGRSIVTQNSDCVIATPWNQNCL